MSEQFFQVSPVQRLVEQVLEHHGTMYAVVLEFVGGPIVRSSHTGQRIELQTGVDIHVVKIDGSLQRNLIARQLVGIVDRAEMRVFHKHVHGWFERTQRTFLLEHPREHGLAGEIKRTNVTREFRILATYALGGLANRRFQLTMGVDELLQRPIQRAR